MNSLRYIKRNWNDLRRVTRHTDNALNHFDSLYSKVYGRAWPSMRLGLLSVRKPCAILNTFIDNDELHRYMIDELNAVHIQQYYKKHLTSYVRWQMRQKLLENKKARKREILAKTQQVEPESIDINSVEVSDISDSELRGVFSQSEGLSSAEDLQAMFSDRRMDDDEKYFINKASTQLSLEDYMPATEFLTKEDLSDESVYYEGYSEDLEPDCEFKEEPTFEFDAHLRAYTFPRNTHDFFDQPRAIKDGFDPSCNTILRLEGEEIETGVALASQGDLLPYYLLDGASLLPVLALDIQMNETCADYCAAPGGKSLAMMMSLKPGHLLCNDSSASRLERLSRVLKLYLPDIRYVQSTVTISRRDARSLVQPDGYDKILIDAPCSNDRHSVSKLENNLFKRARTEERLRLPSTQCDILRSALKSLRPKGSLVYSTCTLSPVENDGVVRRALLQLQEENCAYKFAIMNLKEAFRPLRGLFKFKTNLRYGQQVLPHVCSNFGPMYISKIKRVS